MNNEQPTNPPAATGHDPALIATAIYNAEHQLRPVNRDLFVSRKMLDELLPESTVEALFTKLIELENLLLEIRQGMNTITNRNASLGKGFRNLGFMLATNQSINNFPAFAPNFFTADDFNAAVGDYQLMRNVSERLMGMARDVREMMNIYGNLGFNFALAYYANVRSIATRTGNQTAISVFEILRQYFRSRRPSQNAAEPTEKEIERDIRALLHGVKEGEVVVEGKAAHTATAGEHTVIDTAHKPAVETLRATSVQTLICPACNYENAGIAKFCNNCGKELRIEN